MKAFGHILVAFFLLATVTAAGRDFTNYRRSAGIRMRQITTVCVDDKEFVWCANRLGIVRISSDKQRYYRMPGENESVSAVYVFIGKGSIIAFNDKGLVCRYDEDTDSFVELFDLSSLIDASYLSVTRIMVDSRDRFIISSSEGVFKYDDNAGLALVYPKLSNGEQPSICCSADGRMFLVSSSGIIELDIDNRKVTKLYPEDSHISAQSSYYDADFDRLWIGSSNDGLKWFDLETGVLHDVRGSSTMPVRSIAPYRDGILLVGFDGDGVWFVDSSNGKILEKEQNDQDREKSLGSNGVYDICYHNSVIWVATYSGGLYSCEDFEAPIICSVHRANDPGSLSNNNVNSVIEDSRGRNIAATDNGVNVTDFIDRRWHHLCEGNVCTRAIEDSHGNIWVATWGNGWFVYDGKTLRELEHYRTSPTVSSGLPTNVANFIEDRDGDMWIFGPSSIIRKCAGTGEYREYSNHDFHSACLLPDGTLALACSHALIILDKNENSERVLWNGHVNDVVFDGAALWAATSGRGLLRISVENGEQSFIDFDDGLSTNFVCSLLLDGNDLWIGTEVGLNRLDRRENTVQSFKNIPILGNSSFNTASCFLQKDGVLMFGTADGLLKFNPGQLFGVVHDASIYMDDIRVAGQSVRDLDSISPDRVRTLSTKHSRNIVSFEFISSGASPVSYVFKWKMSPVDKEWNILQGSGDCRYANLPEGRNVLHLVMTDSLGATVDSRDIEIDVAPPFWRTWWFMLLVIALLFFMIQTVWERRSMKIKQRVVPMVEISSEVEKHVSESVPSETDPFVAKAIEVVYEHMQETGFDKDAFASAMNVSASSLYKKLKSLTGQSPSDFIKATKMSTALKLLQTHKHSITEVSEMCGYSSQSYFSTAFKNFYGKSPNEI